MDLLLIEDDVLLGKSLQQGFSEHGIRCVWKQLGRDAMRSFEQQSWDVVVLDLMLPDMSGLEVLSKLRRLDHPPPVLLLTALGSVEERVRGLNQGADDYLVKPFAFAELMARLHALARRASGYGGSEAAGAAPTLLRAGPLTLDISTRCAQREGSHIELTTTEYKLLEFLIRNSDHAVTRRMLCEHLWDANWEGVTNVIEVHINRLRAKVDRGFRQQLIQTVRGIGYAFRTK